jgi:hypothetical protein
MSALLGSHFSNTGDLAHDVLTFEVDRSLDAEGNTPILTSMDSFAVGPISQSLHRPGRNVRARLKVIRNAR